jgi:dihydrofolate reductase
VKINIIMACDQNRVIGINGKLPWNIPEDLKRFKALTMNHAVIMGRKTWESLPVKPLPGRLNIVISQTPEFVFSGVGRDVVIVPGIKEAIGYAELWHTKEVFVIGGARLFEEAMIIADTAYLTVVNHEVEVQPGDEVVRANKLTLSVWKVVDYTHFIDHTFYVLNRRHPDDAITTTEKNHE